MASAAESGHFHTVRFYKDAASLAEIVCTFLADGLKRGEPAVVIATAEHSAFFRECFATKGVDVPGALSAGSLTLLDAEEILSKFMHDGVPMPRQFKMALSPILTSIAARFPGMTIRAYGEMVDVLWKRKETAAAICVETLWNDLARSHRFGLLCGYAIGNFYKGSATDEICRAHTHVMTETGASVALI